MLNINQRAWSNYVQYCSVVFDSHFAGVAGTRFEEVFAVEVFRAVELIQLLFTAFVANMGQRLVTITDGSLGLCQNRPSS